MSPRAILHRGLPLLLVIVLAASIFAQTPQQRRNSNAPQSSQPDSLLWQTKPETLRIDRTLQPEPIRPNFNPFQNVEQSTEEAAQRRQLSQLNNAARQFEFMGQHERALDMYQRMYDIDPDSRQAYDGLKRTLGALGQWDTLELLIRERMVNPSGWSDRASLLAELGGALYKSGQMARADSAWDAALSESPVSERNYQEVAGVQLRLRLMEEAIDTYKLGREDLNRPTLYAINLASLYTGIMNWKDATSEFLLVLRENDRRVHYVRRGLANYPDTPAANEAVIEGIEDELDATRRSEPWPGHRAQLHELLVDQRTKNGQYEEALEAVAELDNLVSAHGDRLLRFAADAINEGYEDVAEQALDIAAERLRDPEGADVVNLMRAQVAQVEENFQRADSLFTVVLDQPASARVERSALMSRGLVRLQFLDQAKDAAKDFRGVRTLGWPDYDRRLDYYEAIALVRIDSLDAALIPLERPLQRERPESDTHVGFETEQGVITDADLTHLAARIMLWQGDKEAASTLLDSVLSPPVGASAENETLLLLQLLTTTQDTTALDLYAEADHAGFKGDTARALTLLDSLAQNAETPEMLRVEAGYNAALLRLDGGDTQAVVDFANANPGHPKVEEAWYLLGQWWEAQGNANEASIAYEMVLLDFPDGLLQALARLRLEELTLQEFLPEPAEG
ncbi:tetratricopeptide repeat protein [bacterium]|nr:tetratricopeptide repeat protein [bacterium]